tara:strand:- start:16 stop:1188 length:1173 start_codon:yes stop_codon:yes gene_type:complete
MDGVTSNVQTQLDAKLPLAGGTMTGDLVPATPMSHRNMIINGAMKIAQRGTQEHPVDTTNYSACDRFQVHNRTAGTCDTYSDSESPDDKGFNSSLKVDITNASDLSTTDNESVIGTYFEGQDLQQIRKGTSEALPLTLSFWVRSPKTGIHIVELYDFDSSTQRFVSAPYTISTANTWQFVTHTFPADTASGKEFDNDNAKSLGIQWWLCAASDFTSGTLDQTWRDEASNSNRAVGQVNVFDNASNNFYLTGIQLELGSSATPFEHRSYAEELLRCQRYYQNSYRQNEEVIGGGSASYPSSQPGHDDGMYNTSWSDGNCSGPTFPVAMRTQPTITLKSFASNTAGKCTVTGTEQSCSATTYNHQWVSHLVVGGSHANGAYVHYAYEATAEL